LHQCTVESRGKSKAFPKTQTHEFTMLLSEMDEDSLYEDDDILIIESASPDFEDDAENGDDIQKNSVFLPVQSHFNEEAVVQVEQRPEMNVTQLEYEFEDKPTRSSVSLRGKESSIFAEKNGKKRKHDDVREYNESNAPREWWIGRGVREKRRPTRRGLVLDFNRGWLHLALVGKGKYQPLTAIRRSWVTICKITKEERDQLPDPIPIEDEKKTTSLRAILYKAHIPLPIFSTKSDGSIVRKKGEPRAAFGTVSDAQWEKERQKYGSKVLPKSRPPGFTWDRAAGRWKIGRIGGTIRSSYLKNSENLPDQCAKFLASKSEQQSPPTSIQKELKHFDQDEEASITPSVVQDVQTPVDTTKTVGRCIPFRARIQTNTKDTVTGTSIKKTKKII